MKKVMFILIFLKLAMISCAEERTITILTPSGGDDYSNGCTSMSPLPITWESNSYTGSVTITLENKTIGYTRILRAQNPNDGSINPSGEFNYNTVYGCQDGFSVTITHNESGVSDTSGKFTLW